MMADRDYKFYAVMKHGSTLLTAVHLDEDAADNCAKNCVLESGVDTYVLEAVRVYRRPVPAVEMTKLHPAPGVAPARRHD